MGDDEFALFALDLPNADEARDVVRQLSQALTFEHLGVPVRVAAGHAIFSHDAKDAEALWLAADASLAQAKGQVSDRLPGAGDRSP